MMILKKLIFAPLFLIAFGFLLYQLNPLFKSYDFIFSLSLSTLIQLTTFAALITLTSLLFVLFGSFATDWKLVIPVVILGSILPMFFINQSLGLILSAGILAILMLTYLALEKTLKTYLNFEPSYIFGPHIRRVGTFLIILFAFTYYLSINSKIGKEGFQIPDSLIDQALKFTEQPDTQSADESASNFSIPAQELESLKQNPELLKQYNIDPKILDSLINAQQKSNLGTNLIQDTLKQAVKERFERMIKPYLGIIPGVLAILFFLFLQTFVTLLNFLIYPLLWVIFYILEKIGFIKFTTEQRTVKKMVV